VRTYLSLIRRDFSPSRRINKEELNEVEREKDDVSIIHFPVQRKQTKEKYKLTTPFTYQHHLNHQEPVWVLHNRLTQLQIESERMHNFDTGMDLI